MYSLRFFVVDHHLYQRMILGRGSEENRKLNSFRIPQEICMSQRKQTSSHKAINANKISALAGEGLGSPLHKLKPLRIMKLLW